MSVMFPFVNIALYLMFALGIILCFYRSFRALVGCLTLKRRLYESRKDQRSAGLSYFLARIVFSATGKENKGREFLLFEALLFFIACACAHVYYNIFVSLIVALLAASVPLVSLVSKIQTQRNRGSMEGPSFVSELYRQYRIENNNIYTALEKTISRQEKYPVCADQCFRLLFRIRASGNPLYVKNCCDDLAFSLGTVWGRNLAYCIYSAAFGLDISSALSDMIRNLDSAMENREERLRLNSEAFRMTLFLIPVIYLSTVLLSVKYLGSNLPRFLHNQFFTPEGLLLFFISAVLFFFNSMLLRLAASNRLDY